MTYWGCSLWPVVMAVCASSRECVCVYVHVQYVCVCILKCVNLCYMCCIICITYMCRAHACVSTFLLYL